MSRILIAALALAFSAAPLLADEAPASAPATPAPAAAPAAAPATPAKPAAKPKKAPAAPSDAPKSEEEKTFYAYGFRIGQNLLNITPSPAEAKALTQGILDVLNKKESKVELAVYLPKLSDMAQKRMAAKNEAESAKNAAEASTVKDQEKPYRDAFAKEDGVKEIPHGGWIKTLTEGTGPLPGADDTVKVNYRGTFIDGKEFDSSYKRNEPATFPLKNVIPCWTNGVAMMKVGSKAKLVCPSDVAYGDGGRPGIPGGATLTFEVELLEIVKADAPKDDAPASKK